jgi:hypothetical protein
MQHEFRLFLPTGALRTRARPARAAFIAKMALSLMHFDGDCRTGANDGRDDPLAMNRKLIYRSRAGRRAEKAKAPAASMFLLAVMLALAARDASALFAVNAPWAKAGTRTTEAYTALTSTDGATLVSVRSPLAALVTMRGAGAGSKAIAALPLPAGSAVELKPGRLRLVLTGLVHPLKLGERVPLTLSIEAADGSRQEIDVNAEVRRLSPIEAERRAQHSHH